MLVYIDLVMLKSGDFIVCPLNCFHGCINVLSVDLHGTPGDI